VSFALILPYHPDRLNDPHPLFIQDLLELVVKRKQLCVNKLVNMATDLYLHGQESRYRKHLFDAVYELKDRTSEGGARAYYIRGDDDRFYLIHAECKKETETDEWMLGEAVEILEALEKNRPLFPSHMLSRQTEKESLKKWRERKQS
jgi:phage-related protein